MHCSHQSPRISSCSLLTSQMSLFISNSSVFFLFSGSKLSFNQFLPARLLQGTPRSPSPTPKPLPTGSSGETLKGQPRDIISPMCPTSPPGSLTGWTCLNHHPGAGGRWLQPPSTGSSQPGGVAALLLPLNERHKWDTILLFWAIFISCKWARKLVR